MLRSALVNIIKCAAVSDGEPLPADIIDRLVKAVRDPSVTRVARTVWEVPEGPLNVFAHPTPPVRVSNLLQVAIKE